MKKWLGVMLAFGLLMAGTASASEGTSEVRNVVGGDARCWVGSILQRNYNYRLIISCRDLTYPASGEEVFEYALWVVPATGKGQPEKLGFLGIGKAEFETRTQFSALLVTKEGRQTGFGQTMGPIVMRGDMQPIRFLETGIGEQLTPTPFPTGTIGQGQSQTPGASGLTKGVALGTTILRIIGVAFLLGIGAVVVVLVVSSLGGKKNPPGV